MRVLMVDDYPGMIEFYELALATRGFQLVGAVTAWQALCLAVEQPFDAMVLDLELPDGSGSDLLRRLRAIPRLRTTPSVGISSYARPDARARFDGFLAKPFSPKALAALLRRLRSRGVPAQLAV